MKLTSPDVRNKKSIPRKFTCDGEDINPRLMIEDVPQGTESLALIIDDPDSPMGTWVHWVVYDIPPISRIDEDSIPGTQGMNDFEKMGYGGPCPRSGTHHYCFKLYALDTKLALKEGASKRKLEQAMQGHILDKADLVGLYKRVNYEAENVNLRSRAQKPSAETIEGAETRTISHKRWRRLI